MRSFHAHTLRFAFCMSALAGCVDAIGFLQLGGYFVAFMSGNTTRLALALSHANIGHILLLGRILGLFVGGAALGTLLARRVGPERQVRAVLLLVTFLLATAATASSGGHVSLAISCMALAMGAENIALQRDGDIVISLTYMTGTLVKLGQRIAQALAGGDRWAWLPFLLLWMSLLAGGIAGGDVLLCSGAAKPMGGERGGDPAHPRRPPGGDADV
ncbi:MAG: YoaK family protein [Alphaproteobacteria bacterium]